MRKLLLSVVLSAAASLAADSSLASLLPGSPRMVAGLNMAQSVNSPLGRFLLSQMKEDEPDLRKFIDATGFDPRKDLRELIVANYDTGPVNPAAPLKSRTLVIAKGNFDAARARVALLKDNAISQMIGGFEVISPKQGQGAVAFLDPATAVAGDIDQVKEALGTASRIAAEQQARIGQMSARYDAWVFTTTPVSSFAGRLAPKEPGAQVLAGGQLLQGVLQASGGLKFGNTVTLDAELLARSDKDAQALVDVFKFITGMLQLNKDNAGAKAEGLAALLEGMKVSASGSKVNMNFSVPELELERLLETSRAARKPAHKEVI